MHTRGYTQRILAAIAMLSALVAGAGAPAQAGLLGIGFSDNKLYDISTVNGAPTNARFVLSKVNMIAITSTGTIYGASQGFPNDVPPGGSLYTIIESSGFPTHVATLDKFIITEGDIAIDPTTDILYAVDGPGELFTINKTTGMGATVGNVGTNLDLSAMAFDSGGNLYIVDSFGPTLLKVNKANAAIISSVSLGSVNQEIGGLAFDPTDGKLYLAAGTTSNLYRVNPTTGSSLELGPITAPGGIGGLAFTPIPTPTRAATWGRLKSLYRRP